MSVLSRLDPAVAQIIEQERGRQVDSLEMIFRKIEGIEAREIMEIANQVFNQATNSTLIYQ